MSETILAALIGAIPTVMVAAAAVYISYNQSRLEKRKAQRELFEKFNQRFDAINEGLNAIRAGGIADNGQRSTQDIVQDYLNLCSEEYLWYKRGLVDREVWSAWLDGINHYLKTPAILEQFANEQRSASSSYYGFFKSVDALGKWKQLDNL